MVTNRQQQIERTWPVIGTGNAGLPVAVSAVMVSPDARTGIALGFQGTGAPVAPTLLSSGQKVELRT